MGSPLQLPELDRHEATSPEDARLAKFRRRQFYGACFVRSINLHGRLTNLYLMAIFSKEILTNPIYISCHWQSFLRHFEGRCAG
jgi:hypothetical protein